MGHFVFATACAIYASKLLPHAQHTLAKHRIFDNLLPYAQCTLANSYRMRSISLQIATVCEAYAKNLLPHAPSTLAICYRMRSYAVVASVDSAYASKDKMVRIWYTFQTN